LEAPAVYDILVYTPPAISCNKQTADLLTSLPLPSFATSLLPNLKLPDFSCSRSPHACHYIEHLVTIHFYASSCSTLFTLSECWATCIARLPLPCLPTSTPWPTQS
jgi:hypothetical protein